VDIILDPLAMQETCRLARLSGMSVGFVPTMGALHEGHLSLIHAARAENDLVAVSIFVNPTQFGEGEDFEKYPRPLEADLDRCEASGVNLVFNPPPDAMYPSGYSSYVNVHGLTDRWEGEIRPGHFQGVATVVMKLLQIVAPDRIYMGEKDFQQLQVIRRMAKDFHLPTAVIGIPTVRDPDGLALSSRNAYLSPEERKAALILPRMLHYCAGFIEDGERRAWEIQRAALDYLSMERAVQTDYVAVVDPETMRELDIIGPEALLLAAIRVGRTRLIDNRLWRESGGGVIHADLG
jgi:pantoate--beta-alanine ligase